MAIRFSSFEAYKEYLADPVTGATNSMGIFIAGLGAGATESLLVVTPMDVIKIRLQSQRHSMSDPLDIPKYRNAAHCAYVMVKVCFFKTIELSHGHDHLKRLLARFRKRDSHRFTKASL